MAEAINPILLYSLMLAMVLSGAGLGIILKLQNNVTVNGKEFNHPFFQWLTMFVGESLCIFWYLAEKVYLKRQYGSVEASPGMQNAIKSGMKTKINPLLLAIPMSCDATASTLLLIAYINIPASIAQMMGGFVVFIVAILSIIFLKRRFHRHHWAGLILIFGGICMVASSALIEKGGDGSGNAPLGVAMMCASIVVQGIQYIVEEKLLGSYYLSPMKAVGWEGITGTILFIILLPILQYIPCTNQICNNGSVENTKVALDFLTSSWPLAIYVFFNIVLVGGMNGLGMVVTKYASAANRVTLQQTKTVIVWVFFLGYPGGGHENFKWLQFGGFIILLIGVVFYNEIIVIPFLGFDKNTKSAKEKKKLSRQSLISQTEPSLHIDSSNDLNVNASGTYTSPKGYDSQRKNQRLANMMDTAAKETAADDIIISQTES